MDKRTAHIWPLLMTILVGAFVAFGSYWLVHLMEGEAEIDVDRFKNEPDYIVEKFSFVRMTPEGKPRYLFSGAKLTHRPADDVSDVDAPRLQSLNPQAPPTTVVAKRARIYQAQNKVDLAGQVVVDRPDAPGQKPLHMQTEALTVYPDDERMETALPVKALVGTTTVTGTGMQADNATSQLHIASRAQMAIPPRTAR
jgi:lipopolysaccharide export system protein LptC